MISETIIQLARIAKMSEGKRPLKLEKIKAKVNPVKRILMIILWSLSLAVVKIFSPLFVLLY